jgi:hypothetical protein
MALNSVDISDDDVHVIRLHGPWQATKGSGRNSEFGTESDGACEPIRVKVPLDFSQWLPADFRGNVSLERAFGLPTNLDDQQSVYLTVEDDSLAINSVALNGHDLQANASDLQMDCTLDRKAEPSQNIGRFRTHRFEVTRCLSARNRLRIELDFNATPQGRLVSAAVEIVG